MDRASHLLAPIVIMIVFLVIFMRRMEFAASRNPVTSLRARQERRLEMKVKFFEALAVAKEGLFEDELLPLAGSASHPSDEEEARKAKYEMIGDGAAEMTSEKKYRLRTVP